MYRVSAITGARGTGAKIIGSTLFVYLWALVHASCFFAKGPTEVQNWLVHCLYVCGLLPVQRLVVVHCLYICGLFRMYRAFLCLLAPWYVLCSFVCLLALFFHAQVSFSQSVAKTVGCLIFICHFPQMKPMISGSFAGNDLNCMHPVGLRHPVLAVSLAWKGLFCVCVGIYYLRVGPSACIGFSRVFFGSSAEIGNLRAWAQEIPVQPLSVVHCLHICGLFCTYRVFSRM